MNLIRNLLKILLLLVAFSIFVACRGASPDQATSLVFPESLETEEASEVTPIDHTLIGRWEPNGNWSSYARSGRYNNGWVDGSGSLDDIFEFHYVEFGGGSRYQGRGYWSRRGDMRWIASNGILRLDARGFLDGPRWGYRIDGDTLYLTREYRTMNDVTWELERADN